MQRVAADVWRDTSGFSRDLVPNECLAVAGRARLDSKSKMQPDGMRGSRKTILNSDVRCLNSEFNLAGHL